MKQLLFCLGWLISSQSFGQVYILNEDFSSASGTNPPLEWKSTPIAGNADDKWHFDNPGNKVVNNPMTSPFAIFDASTISGNGNPEVVSLESPFFDASIGKYTLLFFDHVFKAASGARGKIMAFNGTSWVDVKLFNTSTENPRHEVIDLTAICAGKTNAKIRFQWEGNGEGFWAIDNISIYAPLLLDAGITDIDSPEMPFDSGEQVVKVTLSNLGYSTLTSATIKWSVNGIVQPSFKWQGSVPNGSLLSEISIGTFSFEPGRPAKLKIWSDLPNGNTDQSHLNDSTSNTVIAKFCGIYTIGGIDPVFESFIDAIKSLTIAGVSCPVTFMVRSGIYPEPILFDPIPGSSQVNEITFQAENGDSTSVTLTAETTTGSDYLIHFNNSHYINFRKLKLHATYNEYDLFKFSNGSSHINISNCNIYHSTEVYNHFNISQKSSYINILNNYISGRNAWNPMLNIVQESHHVLFRNNVVNEMPGYNGYRMGFSNANNISVENNKITNCNGGAGFIVQNCQSVNFLNNWIDNNSWRGHTLYLIDSRNDSIIGNYLNKSNGIFLERSEQTVLLRNTVLNVRDVDGLHIFGGSSFIANNAIHILGERKIAGIRIEQLSAESSICFNSISVANINDSTTALSIKGSGDFILKNNILSNPGPGFAIRGTLENYNISWDYNNYFSHLGKLAQVNDLLLDSLAQWKKLIHSDANSFSVNPYFSDATFPSIHQSFLNNQGIPVSEIMFDIDSTQRNQTAPDIGSREFTPCDTDAGIEEISSPKMPVLAGSEPVKVILHNHGTNPLTSVKIIYSVNGLVYPDINWSGNLLYNQTVEVILGNFDFSKESFAVFRAWTKDPNNLPDCKPENDSTLSYQLAAPLCGDFTIGGENPDFINFNEAVTNLKMAGITCPVTFFVRPGQYNEQIEFDSIKGASEINTITFQAANDDSLSAILSYQGASTFDYLIHFNNSHYINFRKLKLHATYNEYDLFKFSNGSSHINISNCNIYHSTEVYNHFNISQKSSYINILNNYISGRNAWNPMLNIVQESHHVLFRNNVVNEMPGYNGYRMGFSNANNISVENNKITNCNGGAGFIVQNCQFVNFLNNWIDKNNWTSQAIGLFDSSNDSIIGNIIRNSRGINLVNCIDEFVSSNQITGVLSDYGILMNSSNSFLINNYINIDPKNTLSCIHVEKSASTNRVAFNSLVSNSSLSTPLSINTSNVNIVKNNIFKNTKGGNLIKINEISRIEFDYNNYFSESGIIGKYLDNNYLTLSSWSAAIDGEANGMNLNPYFASDSTYKVYQRGLNGAGIPVQGVLFDIEGEIRNDQAPDIGCDEFMVDFGITQVISPSNDCRHSATDSLTVLLRQFGDVPFTNIILAAQLDNQPVMRDTIVGTVYNDMVFTFPKTVNISNQGSYTIKCWLVGNSDDNINNDTITVKRSSYPAPKVDFAYQGNKQNLPIQFTGTASIDPPYSVASYEWLFGDGDTAKVRETSHIYKNSGTYLVIFRAYNNMGCYSEVSKQVVVEQYEVLQLTVSSKNSKCSDVCSGEIQITATGGTSPLTLYLDNKLITANVVSNVCAGKYTVKAVDAAGVSKTAEATIITESPVSVNIVADKTEGNIPLDVNLHAEGTGAVSYQWYYNDTLLSENQNISMRFEEPGLQTIILISSSGPPDHCMSSDTIRIMAATEVSIQIPNVFTPNGDEINDTFGAVTTGVKSLEMHIYDRNGRLVHTIGAPEGRWDGTMPSGTKAPPGVYYYYLTARGYDGLDYTRQGNVNLYRDLVTLVPNPVQTKAELDLKGRFTGEKTISVYNVSGILMREWTTAEDIMQIDFSRLKAGLYVLKASGTEETVVVKFIKAEKP